MTDHHPSDGFTNRIHPCITDTRVGEVCHRRRHALDDPGLCLACGAEADHVEPDARNDVCEACNEPQVFGAEELQFLFLHLFS